MRDYKELLKKNHILAILTLIMIIGTGYFNSEFDNILLPSDWLKNKETGWFTDQIWKSNDISALKNSDDQSTSIHSTGTIYTNEIFYSDKNYPIIALPKEGFGKITMLSLRDSTGDQIPPSFRVTFESNEFPLTINGTNYRLDQIKNVTVTKIEIGKPLKLQIRMYENEGTDNVQHVMLYLNQHGPKILNDLSETSIIYEKGKPTEIIDPNRMIENATITQSIEGYKNVFEFEIKFAKKMEKSDLLFRIWDYPRNSVDMHIPNALVVTDESTILKNVPENGVQKSTAKLNETEAINLKPIPSEKKISSTLKQFKDRSQFENITCKKGMTVVIKTGNGFPACVKPDTKIKLIERKWASDTVNNSLNHIEEFSNKSKSNNQTDFTNSIPLTLFPVTPQNVTLHNNMKKPQVDIISIPLSKTNQVKITNSDSMEGQKTYLTQISINRATLYTKDSENIPVKSGFDTMIFDYTVQSKDNVSFYAMFDFKVQFGPKKYPEVVKGKEFSEILHPNEKRNSSFVVHIDKDANQIILNIKDSTTKNTLLVIPIELKDYKTNCKGCHGNLIFD